MFGLEVIFGPIEPLVRIISTTVISYPLKDFILKTLALRSAKNALKPIKTISFKKKILLQLDLYRWSRNRHTRKHNKKIAKQNKKQGKINKKRLKEINRKL